ncbi:DUF5615 family PIN-like protein [uncultured Meiothermus sp.]|uniref:DUF5615 family PIN-like protein n=1 Tax=uncultured Meiothermus sp. TaxID=157471 RepID=UPI00262D62CB|nr:DUF5615 family PIN-like protein [uncultured Meiothermus sp.]
MAHLFADENFPHPVVEALRALGHDVLTVLEAGQAEQAVPDAEILAFATSQNRAVLTLNRKHFIRLHYQQPDHAGIVVCTLDIDFGGQAERIQAALAAQGNMRGRLVRVNRPAKR